MVAKSISLLDALAASDLLGVSPNTLKDWRLRHYGPPPIYLSPDSRRGVRYERADLEAFNPGAQTHLGRTHQREGEEVSHGKNIEAPAPGAVGGGLTQQRQHPHQ